MLQFNPHFRLSAKECLKRSLFDKVRTKSNEKTAVHKINIDVDRDQNQQDYTGVEGDQLSPSRRDGIINHLKLLILKEVNKVNEDNQ